MTTDKRGVSARLLQRQLGLRRYEAAWLVPYKLRRTMVHTMRDLLKGEIEINHTWVGGSQTGLRGSRKLKGIRVALVLVGVENRGHTSGGLRMAVIPDFKAITLLIFITQHVTPSSTIYTDGLRELHGSVRLHDIGLTSTSGGFLKQPDMQELTSAHPETCVLNS